MSDRTCSVPGCVSEPGGRFYVTVQLCGKHYQRLKTYGDPTFVSRPKVNGVAKCQVNGCDKTSRVALYCSMHYSRLQRYGDPLITGGTKNCVTCGKEFPGNRKQSCCSIECRKELILRYGREYQTELRATRPKAPIETYPASCQFCSTQFAATRRKFRYCSTECFLAHRSRGDDPNSVRRKERLNAARVERFSKWSVFERDGLICGICSEPIDRDATFPDPLSASLDHIVPLSKGGEHSRANTRATHLRCNCRKSYKLTG